MPVIPTTNIILVAQLKQGLIVVDTGPEFLVADNIPSNPYDPVNIAWWGEYVRLNDTLYTFVKTKLGYTSDQMQTFFNTCAAYEVSP